MIQVTILLAQWHHKGHSPVISNVTGSIFSELDYYFLFQISLDLEISANQPNLTIVPANQGLVGSLQSALVEQKEEGETERMSSEGDRNWKIHIF
jgi:hypothetical protein